MDRKNNVTDRVPLEKETQNAICEWLSFNGYFFWRQNNTPVFMKKGRKMIPRAMPKYAPKGIPDIIVIHRGVFVGIEVKRQRGFIIDRNRSAKLTADQVSFRYKCEKAGGLYYVVHNLEEVLAINFLSPNKLLP